jgi:hypothetical protein
MKSIALLEDSQIFTSCPADRSNMKVKSWKFGEGQWHFDLLVNINCRICKGNMVTFRVLTLI